MKPKTAAPATFRMPFAPLWLLQHKQWLAVNRQMEDWLNGVTEKKPRLRLLKGTVML